MEDTIKNKNNKRRFFLIFGAVFVFALVVAAFYFAGGTPEPASSGGFPTHNHVSWTCSTCGTVWGPGSSGWRVTHIQEDLFLLGVKMQNWSLPSCFTVDGDYGPCTETAVRRFQSATGIQVDGIVGNQTLSQMESSIFAVQDTYKLRIGPYIRFLMWNSCTGYDNTGSSDIFAPIRTSAEYTSFRNAMPNFGVVKDTGADCDITSGGGGGSGSGGGGGGGSDSTADAGGTDGLMWRCHIYTYAGNSTTSWTCGTYNSSGGWSYSQCQNAGYIAETSCSPSCSNDQC